VGCATEQVMRAVIVAAGVIAEHRSELIELDRAIGDADHGENMNRGFVAIVEAAIKRGASPHGLDLEITESLLMEEVAANIEKLEALRELGVSVSIDDFGTGYSSLAYLAKLPVQSLKIDRSFVSRLTADGRDRTIVGAVVQLARSLGLATVAEGVETEVQLDAVRSLGCTMVQGYLFVRPMPVERLLDGTKRLRREGAEFTSDAVDKACQEASKRGFLN